MDISFDPAKDERNRRERGLSFARVAEFDFESALYHVDQRRHYGEARVIAVGYLDRRLHFLCFVHTSDGLRVISFRRANEREARRYAESKTID